MNQSNPQLMKPSLSMNATTRPTAIALAFVALITTFALTACGSHPIKPSGENVKISRSEASSDCREIGAVEGRNQSTKGTFETALEDLKLDASRQGANFVKIEQTSGTGTAVRGTAYFCP